MTRSSKLALVTLLAGLMSLVSVGAVNADTNSASSPSAGGRYFSVVKPVTDVDACSTPRFACEHYEQMVAEWLAENEG